ncbi:MFS transporter [Streptosporangium sp. NPDC000396]|uniref:MFS transporter n=1 Tax=Streptosporangium sp. NPDC000396 TaxID=3366185 RepID=UPI003675A32F
MAVLDIPCPKPRALAPERTAGRGGSQGRLVPLVALAPFLANADAGIVSLALPDIQRDLAMSLADVHWVTNVYVLLVGGFQLVGGRVADLVGPRRLFLICLAGFAVTSAACGVAPSGGALIAARAAQAVAASLLVPAAMAIMIMATPEPAVRARALAAWASAGGAGAMAGIFLGGLVVSYLDWRWVFYLNVPLAAAVLPIARRLLPRDGHTHGQSVDVPGPLTLVGSLLTLIYALIRIPEHGWDEVTCWTLAAAVALGGFFVMTQARASHPLLPAVVIRDRGLVAGSLAILLVSAATAPVVFVGSIYLQQVHHYSALAAGFALLPMVGGIMLVGRVCNRMLARRGPRLPYVIGCVMTGAGLLSLTRVCPGSGYLADLLPGLALTGAGLPFIWMTSEVVALSRVTKRTVGLATGMVQSAGQIGMAIGLALAVTVFTAHSHDRLSAGADSPTALSDGIGRVFLVSAMLLVPVLINALTGTRGLQKRVTRP